MCVHRVRDVAVVAVVLMSCLAGAAEDRTLLPRERIPKIKPPAEVHLKQAPIRVKVLAIEFNPLIPGAVHSPEKPDAEARSVRALGGWNDPLPLAAGYMQDICDASGGLVQFEIVEWIVAREFQRKTDGYVYTPQAYYDCLTKKAEWRQPDGIDYPFFIQDFKLVPRVESGEIDEVWMFGAPYFGYWEAAMAGKGAFNINGGVYDEEVSCSRPFAIMGFNYERGVAEMLHDLSHRTEATMTRMYGGWKADELTSNWARFAANHDQSNGVAAVGSCHWPPNAEKDYDYANPREVQSSADDWLDYPELSGETRAVTRETWGGPDYHRNYMKWWFTRLPKAPGTNADGRLNNWWEYVFCFTRYSENGSPLKATQ